MSFFFENSFLHLNPPLRLRRSSCIFLDCRRYTAEEWAVPDHCKTWTRQVDRQPPIYKCLPQKDLNTAYYLMQMQSFDRNPKQAFVHPHTRTHTRTHSHMCRQSPAGKHAPIQCVTLRTHTAHPFPFVLTPGLLSFVWQRRPLRCLLVSERQRWGGWR